MTVVLLALAGGIGAASRFLVDSAVQRRNRLPVPIGTLVVNLSACALIGVLTGWAASGPDCDPVTSVLGVGFLGGYSTFSTASVEAARMLLDGRVRAAIVHAAAMLVLCLLAAWGGIALGAVLA